MKKIKLITVFGLKFPMYVGFLKFIVGLGISTSLYSCFPRYYNENSERLCKKKEANIARIKTVFCEGEEGTHYESLTEKDKDEVMKKIFFLLDTKDSFYYNICQILNIESSFEKYRYEDLDSEIQISIIKKFREFINAERGDESIVTFFKKYSDNYLCERLRDFRIKNSEQKN